MIAQPNDTQKTESGSIAICQISRFLCYSLLIGCNFSSDVFLCQAKISKQGRFCMDTFPTLSKPLSHQVELPIIFGLKCIYIHRLMDLKLLTKSIKVFASQLPLL